MKQLKTQFQGRGQVKGYVFKQIAASRFAYIYERTSQNGSTSYEVFKHRENAYYNCIRYPSDKSFGKWAWAAATLERADEIFTTLNRG